MISYSDGKSVTDQGYLIEKLMNKLQNLYFQNLYCTVLKKMYSRQSINQLNSKSYSWSCCGCVRQIALDDQQY